MEGLIGDGQASTVKVDERDEDRTQSPPFADLTAEIMTDGRTESVVEV